MQLQFELTERPPSGQAGEIAFLQQDRAAEVQNGGIASAITALGAEDDLSAAFAAADALSWADAHVARRVEVRIEVRPTCTIVRSHD